MKNFWQKPYKPILALAPMAGVTDSAFRQICKDHGADVLYSEMASATALAYSPPHQKNNKRTPSRNSGNCLKNWDFGVGASPPKTLRLLKFAKKERPYVVQLFGRNPEHFATAAKIITQKIKPDGIDINFGCPARKVFKTGAGCALMADKKLAREIISAACKNTKLPISIKIRAGIKKNTAIEFIKHIKDLPFAAVMVHGRTYESGFAGPADFKVVEKIKKIIPKKIVLANGGINTPGDAVNILKKYPALDGLGIARGAWGKPYIFEQIKYLLDSSTALGTTKSYDFGRIKKIMLQHAEIVWKEHKEPGIKELRKHLAWYVHGFPGASELRQKLVRAKNLKEIKDILKKHK